MLTATGLGSGLDIKSLVSDLVSNERAGSDLQLNRREAKLNSKFSALGSLKSSLGGFNSAISGLTKLSSFNAKLATSADNTAFTASATTSAVANKYSLNVSQLASSHSLASGSFADSNETAIGSGTLTIRRGTTDYNAGTDTYNSFVLNADSTAANITIDSSNNTLEGVMAAINDADIGISAAIVNDGTGFRLLLTSDTTGEENSLEISASDDDSNNTDNSGLSRLAFNASATNLTQTAAAQDANFTINGLSVSNPNNTVTSAIPGVTLTLKKTTTAAVDLTVKDDFTKITAGVSSFIAGYNNYITTVNNLSSYDAVNNVPSALLGDFTLRSINGQIGNLLRNSVTGVTGNIQNLSELGITTTVSGTLVLDSAKLNAALSDNRQNVTQMFAALGVPTDDDISYASASASTVVGNYAVNVSTMASSGFYTGASVLPNFGGGGTVVIDSDNNNLTFEVDGVDAGEITLTAGTYTSGVALANEIQVQLNGAQAMLDASKTVKVTYDSGTNSFSITSAAVGSESTVKITGIDTNSASSLGFSIGDGTAGDDVAGTIGGVAATGVGNVLKGAVGSDAEGLELVIDGGATGDRGTVNFSRGLADQLNTLLTSLLAVDGALASRIDNFKDQIEDVADRRAELELRWAAVEERYTKQFNALDSLLASLETTSSYLTTQFDNLLKPNVNK